MSDDYILYKLNVNVHSAENINLEVLDRFWQPDPYCKISFNDEETKQTKVTKNNPNPEWMESFTFYYYGGTNNESEMKLQVFDQDKFSNDYFIGAVHIVLSFDDNYKPVLKQQKRSYTINWKNVNRVTYEELDINTKHKLELIYTKQLEMSLRQLVTDVSEERNPGTIEFSIKCEWIKATPITRMNQISETDSNEKQRYSIVEQKYNSSSIFNVFDAFSNEHKKSDSEFIDNVNWICDNLAELKTIAGKISKKVMKHIWSINDFGGVSAPCNNLEQHFKDYYLEFVEYATNHKYRVIYFRNNALEVPYEADKFHNIVNDTNVIDITDAVWIMFRQYFVLNVLMRGQYNEFNIFRSYYFTPGTVTIENCKAAIFDSSNAQTKLSLSFLTMLLQVGLTLALVYQVIVDWDFDKVGDGKELAVIVICSVLIFVYLAFVTNSTIRKCEIFYKNIGVICIVPWYGVIGDFIVNVVVPLTICCLSLFFLLLSDSLGDLVLNSFALTFVYRLDDDVNVFERDEEFILREDINLFLRQKEKPVNAYDGLKNNRRQIHMVEIGFMRFFIWLKLVLIAPFYIINNFWHLWTFVKEIFINKIHRGGLMKRDYVLIDKRSQDYQALN